MGAEFLTFKNCVSKSHQGNASQFDITLYSFSIFKVAFRLVTITTVKGIMQKLAINFFCL